MEVLSPSGSSPEKGHIVYSVDLKVEGGFVFPNPVEEVRISRESELLLIQVEGIRALLHPDQPVLMDGCCWTPANQIFPGRVLSVISPLQGEMILRPAEVEICQLWPAPSGSIEFRQVRVRTTSQTGDADLNNYFVGDENGGILVHGFQGDSV